MEKSSAKKFTTTQQPQKNPKPPLAQQYFPKAIPQQQTYQPAIPMLSCFNLSNDQIKSLGKQTVLNFDSTTGMEANRLNRGTTYSQQDKVRFQLAKQEIDKLRSNYQYNILANNLLTVSHKFNIASKNFADNINNPNYWTRSQASTQYQQYLTEIKTASIEYLNFINTYSRGTFMTFNCYEYALWALATIYTSENLLKPGYVAYVAHLDDIKKLPTELWQSYQQLYKEPISEEQRIKYKQLDFLYNHDHVFVAIKAHNRTEQEPRFIVDFWAAKLEHCQTPFLGEINEYINFLDSKRDGKYVKHGLNLEPLSIQPLVPKIEPDRIQGYEPGIVYENPSQPIGSTPFYQ